MIEYGKKYKHIFIKIEKKVNKIHKDSGVPKSVIRRLMAQCDSDDDFNKQIEKRKNYYKWNNLKDNI